MIGQFRAMTIPSLFSAEFFIAISPRSAILLVKITNQFYSLSDGQNLCTHLEMATRVKAKTPTKKELLERLARLEAANTVSELPSNLENVYLIVNTSILDCEYKMYT